MELPRRALGLHATSSRDQRLQEHNPYVGTFAHAQNLVLRPANALASFAWDRTSFMRRPIQENAGLNRPSVIVPSVTLSSSGSNVHRDSTSSSGSSSTTSGGSGGNNRTSSSVRTGTTSQESAVIERVTSYADAIKKKLHDKSQSITKQPTEPRGQKNKNNTTDMDDGNNKLGPSLMKAGGGFRDIVWEMFEDADLQKPILTQIQMAQEVRGYVFALWVLSVACFPFVLLWTQVARLLTPLGVCGTITGTLRLASFR